MSSTDVPPMLSHLIATVPGTRLSVEDAVRVIDEQVVIRPQSAPMTTHVAVADEQWTWQQLRDYVVGEIEKITGVFPRDERKEYGIFSSFVTRWGSRSPQIARYAFEVSGGYWKNAPISVTRFCKGSDEYFAAPIVKHLDTAATARSSYA